MKRNIFPILLTISLAFIITITNCSKPEKNPAEKSEIAQELIHKLNAIPIGITFEVEPANITVETLEKGRYLIAFKDPTTLIDTSALKDFNIGFSLKDSKILVKSKEVVYKYSPEEKYLELVSIKGMSFDWDFSELMKIPEEMEKKSDLAAMNLRFSVENITYSGYNVSPLLDTKTGSLIELVGELLEKNPSHKYTMENLSYEIHALEKQKQMSFLIEAEKLEGYQEGLSDIFISLYIKGGKSPDLAKTLKQGKSLLDLGMRCSSFKLSIKENDKLLGGGAIKDMNLAYFLKPDKNNSFFIYTFTWDLSDLTLSIPGNKDIEAAGHIKEMGFKFSLENLSAAFVQAYFDLVRKSMELSATMDKEKIRQQQMMMGMTIATEFMKSQPAIKCSISPFKHNFGQLEAEVNFKFLNLMAPPVGKAVLKIPQIEDMLSRMKNSLSTEILEALAQMAEKYVIIDEQGNGTVTLETKQDQPGKFFLNGKSITK